MFFANNLYFLPYNDIMSHDKLYYIGFLSMTAVTKERFYIQKFVFLPFCLRIKPDRTFSIPRENGGSRADAV